MSKEIQVETPEEKEVFDAMTKEQSKPSDELKEMVDTILMLGLSVSEGAEYAYEYITEIGYKK